MVKIGETVLYGTTGVCRVDGVTEKEIAHVKKEYYVLCPLAQERSAVFVPVDNPALVAKMKRILSKDEIYALLQSLPKDAPEWEEDNAVRRERFTAILANGDRAQLMQLVRAVYLHRQELAASGRRLHLVDERVMKEAERLLYEEFSVVLGIEQDEVVPFIIKTIEE